MKKIVYAVMMCAASAAAAGNTVFSPMIAQRTTPVPPKVNQGYEPACDEKTPDGLALNCPIHAKLDTEHRTEDGLPMIAIPTIKEEPTYDQKGTVTFTVDQYGAVGAEYQTCHTIGTGDMGERCDSIDFSFPKLSYDEATRSIKAGDEVIARYQDAKDWTFPKYFKKGARLAGWVCENDHSLAARWPLVNGERTLEVALH